ncbi:CatB-related O-acetyltransferase [Vibrio aphrogenes]|uniref:CatB-related O-acetyltransferase n=1 Tax=Vibrio aphrogenes TaxID=1891186 RepID=UPI000B363209|nr:CatB-related O-acetyltransferase [Vibrio aphrogenes]
MHLNLLDKIVLNYCGKYIAKKFVGQRIFQPHKGIVFLIYKAISSKEKMNLAKRYISERFFFFSVGKHSKGYEQFWRVDNNGKRLLAKVGSFCSFAPNITVVAGNHPIHFKSTHAFLYRKNDGFISSNMDISQFCNNDKVNIGSDVWIGANVTILPGAHIAHGAVVAAGSVVNKNVPPYAIVAGVPAKIIKYRFSPETIEFLLQEKWWEWEDEKIKQQLPKMYNESDWF